MEARRTTVRDMRRSNRSVILTSIYREGPLSRQELTVRTSLSAASVSNLVAELIAEGVVEEAGSVESEGGRPRVLYGLSTLILLFDGLAGFLFEGRSLVQRRASARTAAWSKLKWRFSITTTIARTSLPM